MRNNILKNYVFYFIVYKLELVRAPDVGNVVKQLFFYSLLPFDYDPYDKKK